MTASLLTMLIAGFTPGLSLVAVMPQGPDIETKITAMLDSVRASKMREANVALVSFGTRHVLSSTTDSKKGTGAARRWLQKKLESFIPMSDGRLTVESEVYTSPSMRLRQNVKIVNIVATLRGVSDPDRVYVVGGHYDSRNSRGTDGENAAPGANDDGSGTCVVIEACRVMCKHPFAATIKFVCYDGEEQGLLGSEAHAKALADAGTNVDGMITNDIVGNTLGMDGKRRRGYLRCFSYSATGNDSIGRSLARAATYGTRQHVQGFAIKMVYRGDRYGRGGDHKSFNKRGYPAIRLTEPREDYSRQHQNITQRDGEPYGDLTKFMDFDYMTKVVGVNVALLTQLASAPRAPQRAVASGAREAYDTNLSWSKVAGVDKYEVVWRQTTSLDWEGTKVVDQPTESKGRRSRGMLGHVLPGVCLDDVVVGVRSVGSDGSRSRVVTPPEPDSFNQRRARKTSTGSAGKETGKEKRR
jgi:hypothetical protein